ncbi:uncharacterized protein MEPE_03995 [Melanopsichium pennsylvanicum]|uniref:Uncharacterized protein n=2 Tax=Melanopsichium pennsylvanicum TaxID=63383 RepID=A0AAJ4XP06_9BASI|nr:putative protein [Melanopsichium pennsylvanicum 4]SNX85286.1 uncharacterized protein MEPE_03995 [Melanopsichium pennsylvanicum]
MFHSNTNASSFKLQPAPRPKAKKRPQNPPPLHITPSAESSRSATEQSPITLQTRSDNSSLRSCSQVDEDALTPKASLLQNPLLIDQERAAKIDNTSFSPPRRPRASTTSLASALSATSASSVTRLLASMSPSISPRRSKSAVQPDSPSATLTVVLTNKSPTPCSPLFPRRTLMRSISSTCLNNHPAKSPTSPVNASSRARLRKRMGWRGALSASMHEETAILMSPGSPLTPSRASTLHTPTQASIASLLGHSNLLSPHDVEEQLEPLSATLKALGAKRRTETLPSACIPVQSSTFGSFHVVHTHGDIKSPFSEAEFTANQERFQVITATRKIFQLPTWVRFEANHHARTKAAEENRKAAAEFSKLPIASKQASVDKIADCKQDALSGKALPKTSHLGDVAPDSPNGELFAGFDIGSSDTLPKSSDESGYVVSVVRRPSVAAFRKAESTKGAGGKVFASIRSALPPFRPQGRIKDSSPQSMPEALGSSSASTRNVVKQRRDGWGGVLTRSSWFPSHTKGPLVSPSSPASGRVKRKGLKKMLLQSSIPVKAHDKRDDEWEDIDEIPCNSGVQVSDRSFLELEDVPRFFNRPPTTRGWFSFLPSRFRAQKKQHDFLDEHELNHWRTRSLKLSPAEEQVISSQLIAKGERSLENRPVHKSNNLSLRMRITVFVITTILISAVVGNVVILTRAVKTSQKNGDDNTKSKVSIVGNLPLSTTSTSLTQSNTLSNGASQSSVTKAAQLSQA